jgi:hypothetical protein
MRKYAPPFGEDFGYCAFTFAIALAALVLGLGGADSGDTIVALACAGLLFVVSALFAWFAVTILAMRVEIAARGLRFPAHASRLRAPTATGGSDAHAPSATKTKTSVPLTVRGLPHCFAPGRSLRRRVVHTPERSLGWGPGNVPATGGD